MATQQVSTRAVCGLLLLLSVATIGSVLLACTSPIGSRTDTAIEAFFANFDEITQPPEGKYLFVEMWVEYEGPGMTIDKPRYGFDPTTKVLDPFGYHKERFPLGATDWGLIG